MLYPPEFAALPPVCSMPEGSNIPDPEPPLEPVCGDSCPPVLGLNDCPPLGLNVPGGVPVLEENCLFFFRCKHVVTVCQL